MVTQEKMDTEMQLPQKQKFSKTHKMSKKKEKKEVWKYENSSKNSLGSCRLLLNTPVQENASMAKPKSQFVAGKKSPKTAPKSKVTENIIKIEPESPAVVKNTKRKVKSSLTKMATKSLIEERSNKLSAAKKSPLGLQVEQKTHKRKRTKTDQSFSVCFPSVFVSLNDPTVKKVLEVLSKADDIKIHRKMVVSCSDNIAANKLKLDLQNISVEGGQTFQIRNKLDSQIFSHKMMYVLNLPRDTTEKDLKNSFPKAISVHIANVWKKKKMTRVGHIRFADAADVNEALAIKNRRICGNYVQVTRDRSRIENRLHVRDVTSSPAKRAKMDIEEKEMNNDEEEEEDEEDNDSEEEEDNDSEEDEDDGDDAEDNDIEDDDDIEDDE